MPAVYRGMSQEELEAQYNARDSVTDFPGEMTKYRQVSDQAYENCSVRRDLAYGPGADELLDFFPAGAPGGPVFIYVHGGYWRALGRADSAFVAPGFVRQGVSVAIVEYTLAPVATLDQIVDQVRRAFAFVHQQAVSLQIDPSQIYICGSSAGAHLCAMALATDWKAGFGLPPGLIQGAVLVSGLYDLEPVRLCVPNSWLNLDKDAVERNSPIHYLPKQQVNVLTLWGEYETDEFKRQSRDFVHQLRSAGFSCAEAEIQARNHFDVILELADPVGGLFQKVMLMIGSDH